MQVSYIHIKIALALDECGIPLPGAAPLGGEGPPMKAEEPSRVSGGTVINGGAIGTGEGGAVRRKLPGFMGGGSASKRSNTNVG